MALLDDGYPVCVHVDPDSGDIARKLPQFSRVRRPTGFDSLPVRAVEAKDPIGFRDRVPTLKIE